MTRPWWTGVPAAQTTLACGEATHRLRWSNGTLATPDHADPEAERALAALGGEPLACITLLDTWRAHAEDPNVLLLASRGPADLIAVPEETPHQISRRPRPATLRPGARNVTSALMLTSSGRPLPVSDPDPEEHLARLLSLGGGLSRRLDATVAAYWRERLLTPDAETDRLQARLHAALYGRVLATLSGWLGQSDVALELELAPEAATPSLQRAADGGLAAILPFGWLTEVWARGLEVIWGRFCLAASSADGLVWKLHTVSPDLNSPAILTVTLPD